MSSFQSFDPQFDSPYYNFNIDDSIIGKHPTFNRLQYINNCNKDSLNSVDILDTSNDFNPDNESVESNKIPVKYKSSLHRRYNLPKDDISETLSQDSTNSINSQDSINSINSQDSQESVKLTDSGSFSISGDLKKEHFNVISSKYKKEKNKESKRDHHSKDYLKDYSKQEIYNNFKPLPSPVQKPIQPIYISNTFPKFNYEKIKMFIICLLFGIITIIILNICFKVQLKFYLNKNKIPIDNIQLS